jgi:hypothetical protein
MVSNVVIPGQEAKRSDLVTHLNQIWRRHFADTPRVNEVEIAYCAPWKSRLGLIRLSVDYRTTFIGINALLQLEVVPEGILTVTIAHELVHYAHGFGSPLPRPYRHPHANKIVDRELERRELGRELSCCNEWIDKNWYSFYDMQRASGWADLAKLANAGGITGRAGNARANRSA